MSQNNENNISGRIDRLPLCSVQWRLWGFHEVCFILGHIGLVTATFLLVPIGNEFGMNATHRGLIASVVFVGMFMGALVAGYLADRFGRKPLLIAGIATWSAGALLLAWSPNETIFFLARFIVGLGMGAHFPMTQTMLTELFPASARGRAVCLMEGGYPLAAIIAGILSWVLLMFLDWRSVFFVQGLGGLCIGIALFRIPESARWLARVGRVDEAKALVESMEQQIVGMTGEELPPVLDAPAPKVPSIKKARFLQLFVEGQTRKTVTVWLLWFCVLFGHYGLNTWISALLVETGFDIVSSNGYVLLMYLPAVPGYLMATYLVEKLGRKKTIFGFMFLAAVFCYLYGTASTFGLAIVFGCCMQFFMFGIWSLIYTYAAEVFPTHVRALGAGTTSAVGRLGALTAPTLFGILLPTMGNDGLFGIGAGVYLLGGLIVLLFGVETKGRSLEDI